MAGEKIATRIKDPVTGEEYLIGTTGSSEKVMVKLSAPLAIEWENYHVKVQDRSDSFSSGIYPLNALGECSFNVQIGHIYEVSLPVLEQYPQPVPLTYTASMASRKIEYAYNEAELLYEQVNIRTRVVSVQDGVEMLDGLLAVARCTDGTAYVGEFSNGHAEITIPYGKEYTIAYPTVGGYYHDHANDTFVSGVASREIYVHYYWRSFGVNGLDADGNLYTLDEIKALEDKSIIVAASYNDAELEVADRGDGTTGCGFMWKIGETTASAQWAVSNVEFDTARLPFVTSDAIGLQHCAGARYTQYIIEIGEEISVATPAATNCRNSTITIGGVTRNGYLPAYGQLRRLALNYSAVQALYSALGKTAPAITSGFWWTSCQVSAQYAVILYNGGFGNDYKTDGNSVLRVYDL